MRERACPALPHPLLPALVPSKGFTHTFTAESDSQRSARYDLGTLLTSVSAPELLRLKKRFMKLDKDGSGSIDKDEFLQIPQIANNPLAHRMIAIFDEE